MSEIHNAELSQDIIIGAVAAWLEQTNDSAVSIEIAFQRDATHTSNFDLIAATKVEVLKAEDFRPMRRGQIGWTNEDQMMMSEWEKRDNERRSSSWRRDDYEGGGSAERNKSAEWKSAEYDPARKTFDETVDKKHAVKWEVPSGDFYPIEYIGFSRRPLNRRKSLTEVFTAQEAPAVREKGDANDQTDQDCRTLPTERTSSSESLASEAPTQRGEKSPMGSPKAISPIRRKKAAEAKEDPEEEVSGQRSPVKTAPYKVSLKRRPDSGELKILAENPNGTVTFKCSTKHRTTRKKMSPKKNE